MRGMGENPGEDCTFAFNMDPSTFKPGDLISYRVPEAFGDMPFVGEIVSVEQDHIVLRHYGEGGDGTLMKGSLEDRPVVSKQEALGED